MNFNLEYDIDSSQQVEIRTNGSLSNGLSDQTEYTETFGNTGDLANTNSAIYDADDQRWSFDGNLYYRKRFGAKRGRSMTMSAEYQANNSNSDGRLMSLTDYINSGDVRILDQIQDEIGDNRTWGRKSIIYRACRKE